MGRYGKKKRFISPHLSQFILDRVKTLTPEQYDTLDAEDRAIIKKIGYSSLEEKLWILGKTGSRFAIVVLDRKKVIEASKFTTNVNRMLTLLKHKLSLAIGPTLSAYGIFALADEGIMKSLSAVSNILNHRTYYIIRDYSKLTENMERVEDAAADAEMSKQAKQTLDKFILQILIGTETISKAQRKNPLGISPTQFSILLYLNIHEDHLVSENELAEYFSGNQQSIMKNVKMLIQKGYVEEHKSEEQTFYVFTGMGEITLNRLRNYLIQKTR